MCGCVAERTRSHGTTELQSSAQLNTEPVQECASMHALHDSAFASYALSFELLRHRDAHAPVS